VNVERLKKLEVLLGRVQKNAVAPRPLVARLELSPSSEQAPAETGEVSAELQTSVSEGPAIVAEAPASTSAALPPVQEPPPVTLDEGDRVSSTMVEEDELLEIEEEIEELEVEEPPASSRRVAASMDEALAGAAHQLEPPRTIPPESGPEPLSSPELEMMPPAAEGLSAEPLGQTVSLEEAAKTGFESKQPSSEPPPVELEPSTAWEAGSSASAEPPESLEAPAQVLVRPAVAADVVEFIEAPVERRPRTFADLLDDSLSLGT
jgi:hypothetical protein